MLSLLMLQFNVKRHTIVELLNYTLDVSMFAIASLHGHSADERSMLYVIDERLVKMTTMRCCVATLNDKNGAYGAPRRTQIPILFVLSLRVCVSNMYIVHRHFLHTHTLTKFMP